MTSKQHYLIPMTRGLGSIRTIHGAFLHSATDREKLHTVLRRRSQFFFFIPKVILERKQKTVIGALMT